MKRQIFILSTLLIIIVGCSKENELKKSVYINDTEYSDLPAYSEWGYNTFGAYYDRDVFIFNNKIVPAKVIVSNNSTSFILDGQKGSSNYYSNYFTAMTMTFEIAGFAPDKYTDLIVFNDTIFDLKNPLYKVSVQIDTIEYSASILSGQLTFKKVQNLKVDNKQVEVILSGYFEFKALVNKKPVTISDGRFDVGVNFDNFYNY